MKSCLQVYRFDTSVDLSKHGKHESRDLLELDKFQKTNFSKIPMHFN